MSLVFVRHGETALNVARTVQPADTPLSARGMLQAEQVAKRLAGFDLAAIVSSDLPRALATARQIALVTGTAVEIDPLWRERDFGDWRGRRYDELGLDPRTTAEAPPRGETADAFRGRVALAFAKLLGREPAPGALVVVTHGLVIRTLIEAHLVLPAPLADAARLGNTSVTVASREAPHVVSVFDCLSHLDAATRHDETSVSGL